MQNEHYDSDMNFYVLFDDICYEDIKSRVKINMALSYNYNIKGTDLFLTEDLDARVRFLWGSRGAAEGAGGVWGAGGEVRGRRPPAAAALASNTTINHLVITISRYARDARLTFQNVLSQQPLADSRRRTRTQRRSLLLCLWWRPTPMKVGFHWSPQRRQPQNAAPSIITVPTLWRRCPALVQHRHLYISAACASSTR